MPGSCACAPQSGRLHVGQFIHEIDGQSVLQLNPAAVTQMLRGSPGSEVKLRISSVEENDHGFHLASEEAGGFKTVLFDRSETGAVGISFMKVENPGPYFVRSLDPNGPAAQSGNHAIGTAGRVDDTCPYIRVVPAMKTYTRRLYATYVDYTCLYVQAVPAMRKEEIRGNIDTSMMHVYT